MIDKVMIRNRYLIHDNNSKKSYFLSCITFKVRVQYVNNIKIIYVYTSFNMFIYYSYHTYELLFNLIWFIFVIIIVLYLSLYIIIYFF